MIKKPIGNGWAAVLILVAGFFDAISLLPGVDVISVAIGQVIMAALFYLAGTNVWKERPAVLYAVTTIIELLPFAGVLPMFLVQTIALIALSRRQKA